MGTIEATEVYTRDLSSGTVHKRYLVPGIKSMLVLEADNLDQAGEYEVISDLVGVDLDDLCRRCFPTGPALAPVEGQVEVGF